MITQNQVVKDKFAFFRSANMPADIALDLAQRFAQVFATKRNAESGFDRIGEQDEKQRQWAKEWNEKETCIDTQQAQVNALARVEVEEQFPS